MMGRIDEALRRAGALPTRDDEAVGERGDLFVAPWSMLEDRRDQSSRVDAVVPNALEDGSLAAAPRLHVVNHTMVDGLKPGWSERLSTSSTCDPALNEEFRQLAANLFHSRRTDGVKTIMITSAEPADGKTLVALNVAMVLSGSFGNRVLLIDADLRRPAISEALNVRTGEGLSEALRARRETRPVLVNLTQTLTLLPAGRPDPEPLSGLTSPRMQKLLEEASSRFDWVIVDTPPVGAAADAGLLSPMVHGVLLVVRARKTAYRAVDRAVEALGRDRILGVVLNGVVDRKTTNYYGYYYSPQAKSR